MPYMFSKHKSECSLFLVRMASVQKPRFRLSELGTRQRQHTCLAPTAYFFLDPGYHHVLRRCLVRLMLADMPKEHLSMGFCLLAFGWILLHDGISQKYINWCFLGLYAKVSLAKHPQSHLRGHLLVRGECMGWFC
ncbi:unnamed protein product [Triticum turgidum subsp. durum]|uniref:Uncharacterized protein n=1 Tax=Triticum turgidum subsp. durum TaxID=4567 RepID=A0A9R0ZZE6_TRITD|nr:unnamed protein product [Triticum turgidum subsp. durum]